MQGRQQSTGEFAFAGSLVHGQGDHFFDHFAVVGLAVEFQNGSNDFVGIARLKVLRDGIGHLDFEFAHGQHGSVNGFSRMGFVVPHPILGGFGTAQNIRTLLGFVVQGIVLGNGGRMFQIINGIEVFLPFALAVSTLFLVARIVILTAGVAVGTLASNVAVGRAFFDFGFVRIDQFGFGVGITSSGSGFLFFLLFELFYFFGLDLRRCGTDALTGRVVDAALLLLLVVCLGCFFIKWVLWLIWTKKERKKRMKKIPVEFKSSNG